MPRHTKRFIVIFVNKLFSTPNCICVPPEFSTSYDTNKKTTKMFCKADYKLRTKEKVKSENNKLEAELSVCPDGEATAVLKTMTLSNQTRGDLFLEHASVAYISNTKTKSRIVTQQVRKETLRPSSPVLSQSSPPPVCCNKRPGVPHQSDSWPRLKVGTGGSRISALDKTLAGRNSQMF